jgi:GntR family transcriptional regulator
MIDKRLSIPLYMQIHDLVLQHIRDGEYLPGDQVPSELEISARHQVSRMTARKALDLLVSKGFLYRSQGKGTYVAENTVAFNLSTMLSFSRTLQAQGYEVETQLLRKEIIPGAADVLKKLQLQPENHIIVIQRLRRVQGQPATIHTSFLEQRTYEPIMQIDLTKESLLDVIQRISRTAIAYTQDSVQADVATTEEANWLEISPNSPVLRVEGVAYAENGQPTRLTKAVYRGDMFKLIVKNTAEFATTLRISDTLASGKRT